MPELPEVEHARKLCEAVSVGRRIERVSIAADPIVLPDGPAKLKRGLTGRRVVAAHRHGKYLWLELEGPPHLLVHFGMTGAIVTPDRTPLLLSSTPRGEPAAWPPRFCKVRLTLDDGCELAFVNKRRLGRLRLQPDPRAEPPISALGFDALHEVPSPAKFRELVQRRAATLKGLLLDQSFAAGVGNWIADEVLFQAGLDPRRRGRELTDEEVEALRRALRHVIRHAVKVDARKDRFPRTWLFHHRWGKSDGARTFAGDSIEFIEVAGRTTAFVPARQR